MAISFVGSSSISGTSPQTLTLPSVQANDFILIVMEQDTSNTTTNTTPSGYTSLHNTNIDNLKASIFYKVATGGETTASIAASGTPSTLLANSAVYRGVLPTSPVRVSSAVGVARLTTTTPTTPSETGAVIGTDWSIVTLAGGRTSASSSSLTYPSGYTGRQTNTNGVPSVVAIGDQIVSASPSPGAAFSMTNNGYSIQVAQIILQSAITNPFMTIV